MLGTETYGTGGTISGGADSFTWAQTAYDNATIDEYGNNGTMGAALDYHLVLLDIVEDTFNDTGTDILGASDSILGGCDTYTDSQQHNLDSTVNAFGTTSAPYYLSAYGWDDSNLNDTGSSTLTTNGHVYATDTYGYAENSGSTITDSSSESYDNYELTKTLVGQFNGVDSEINNSATSMSGNTSTGLSGSSYSYYTIGTLSDVDTASGDVTDGGVTPFAYSSTTTMTDALDVSSPPAATVTLESVAGSTSTGSIASPANFTETTTAGHADSSGSSVAENLGSYNSYHAVHDGADEPTLDSSKGLVSAVGGQDANAMEFVGPEVHVAQNATNTAMVVDEGWSGASPITSWVSHPSAIGYRRQGALTIGSGSGAHTLTIEAVAPEFDSGMNDGTDGQELERVANFYTGAQENPTSAQSAPTPRAGQQTSGMGAPGDVPSTRGITDPSSGKEPTWTPAFNPYSGHGNYNPFAGWSWPSFGPFGGGDDGGTGGIPNADGSGTDSNGAALTMLPGYPGTSPGSQGGGTDSEGRAPGSPPLPPDTPPPPPPGPTTPIPTAPAATAPGSQVDPTQPVPPQAAGANGTDAAGAEPWYDDHWSDWLNPFAYGASFAARFPANGEQIGALAGALMYNNAGTEKNLSIAQQNRINAELANPDSSMTVGEAQQQRKASLQQETNEVTDDLQTTADGIQAGAGIVLDTAAVAEMGAGGLRAVRPRPQGLSPGGVQAGRQALADAEAPLINCFPQDTLVDTETGLRAMAGVERRDRVWSYEFGTGEWRLSEVEFRHDSDYDGPLVTIELESGNVTSTAYHPFWVMEGHALEYRSPIRHVAPTEDRDQSLPGRWVNSHDVIENDIVFIRGAGPTKVRRVAHRQERTPVCNLTIRGLHTFCVGETQVLVHNVSGTGGPSAPKSISTGRTVPNSLKEKLAMEEVMANPGGKQLPIKMSDTQNNLLAEDGWVKMAQNVNGAEIHYVKNTKTGQIVDFKFRD